MAETMPVALPDPLLTVSTLPRHSNGRLITVSLAGELDRSNEREARSAIERALGQGSVTLIIDLGRLAFMDSSGVSLLLHAYHTLMKRHGKLVLVAPPGPVRRVLEMVRLSPMVPIYTTLAQAVAETSAESPGA
ncbi:MAG TPA: STAS domain-containing protein [Armatimonadetes bacterium]|jgi:anti-sigma B factor antagonist|nr:STAS domain-containing protein [Armatimonadota bacterium]